MTGTLLNVLGSCERHSFSSSSRLSDGNSSLLDEGGSASQVPHASVQLAGYGSVVWPDSLSEVSWMERHSRPTRDVRPFQTDAKGRHSSWMERHSRPTRDVRPFQTDAKGRHSLLSFV